MSLGRRLVLRGAPLLALGAGRPVSIAAAPMARIQAGAVRGTSRDGVDAFLGIPYGHVPARFRPPEPAAAWSGVREATSFGPPAAQRLGGTAHGLATSEQCLSVNVWTPAGASRAPVLVWVHGGGNVNGASSQPIYDGARFARSGIVCVSFNYRLGLFGFLELGAALGPSYRGSGNTALRDQLLLLRWVRDNIAAFGGDPARVTLAGQSAGAKDVAALLASPASRGLVHRAILESGGGRTVLPRQVADAVGLRVLTLLGLERSSGDRILRLDTEQILAAQSALIATSDFAYPLRPVVDGALLPAAPEQAIARGAAQRVPLLLGTNRDEARLFLARRAASLPLPGRDLSNMDADGFERVLRRYDASITSPDPAEIRWRALTAEEYWVPSIRLAEAQSGAGGPVWMYRFDRTARSGRYQDRAAHVCELPYVWDNPDDPQLAPLIAGFDASLASRVHAAWVAFIAHGAPAAAGLPAWPRYRPPVRATMLLDSVSRIENDPAGAERRLWSELFPADADIGAR